jgi:hypothetical protein
MKRNLIEHRTIGNGIRDAYRFFASDACGVDVPRNGQYAAERRHMVDRAEGNEAGVSQVAKESVEMTRSQRRNEPGVPSVTCYG